MSIDKICLGTVQLGLSYGIANKTGKPDEKKAFEILDKALESGVCCLDTAAVYGDAESVIGRYIRSNKCEGSFRIISKLKPLPTEHNRHKHDASIRHELECSMERLGVDFLDGYLVHKAADFFLPDVADILQKLKNEGLVGNIGVSVYTPEEAVMAAKSGYADYIQVPYNLLDKRLDKVGFFLMADENNIKVFARSAFLQGLILMPVDEVPAQLHAVKRHIARLDELLSSYSLTRLEAALCYSLYKKGIDYVVAGAENKQQIAEICSLAGKEGMLKGFMAAFENEFMDVEEKLLSPNLWYL